MASECLCEFILLRLPPEEVLLLKETQRKLTVPKKWWHLPESMVRVWVQHP